MLRLWLPWVTLAPIIVIIGVITAIIGIASSVSLKVTS
jgi:hypothetical protein